MENLRVVANGSMKWKKTDMEPSSSIWTPRRQDFPIQPWPPISCLLREDGGGISSCLVENLIDHDDGDSQPGLPGLSYIGAFFSSPTQDNDNSQQKTSSTYDSCLTNSLSFKMALRDGKQTESHATYSGFDATLVLLSPLAENKRWKTEGSGQVLSSPVIAADTCLSFDILINDSYSSITESEESSITTIGSVIKDDSFFVHPDSDDDRIGNDVSTTLPTSIIPSHTVKHEPDDDKENQWQCTECQAWIPLDTHQVQKVGVCSACEWKPTTKPPRRRRSNHTLKEVKSKLSAFKPVRKRRPLAALSDHNKCDPYKTTLCNHWLKGKECPYGAACHFAHGQGELRPNRRFQTPSKKNHRHETAASLLNSV